MMQLLARATIAMLLVGLCFIGDSAGADADAGSMAMRGRRHGHGSGGAQGGSGPSGSGSGSGSGTDDATIQCQMECAATMGADAPAASSGVSSGSDFDFGSTQALGSTPALGSGSGSDSSSGSGSSSSSGSAGGGGRRRRSSHTTAPCPDAPAGAEPVTVSGFLMDNFCIDRGTLMDAPTFATLTNPEEHSIHCLVDMDVCVNSGYALLADPATAGADYTVRYQLEPAATALVVAAGEKERGLTGEQTGWRATVTGIPDGDGGLVCVSNVATALEDGMEACVQQCLAGSPPAADQPQACAVTDLPACAAADYQQLITWTVTLGPGEQPPAGASDSGSGFGDNFDVLSAGSGSSGSGVSQTDPDADAGSGSEFGSSSSPTPSADSDSGSGSGSGSGGSLSGSGVAQTGGSMRRRRRGSPTARAAREAWQSSAADNAICQLIAQLMPGADASCNACEQAFMAAWSGAACEPGGTALVDMCSYLHAGRPGATSEDRCVSMTMGRCTYIAERDDCVTTPPGPSPEPAPSPANPSPSPPSPPPPPQTDGGQGDRATGNGTSNGTGNTATDSPGSGNGSGSGVAHQQLTFDLPGADFTLMTAAEQATNALSAKQAFITAAAGLIAAHHIGQVQLFAGEPAPAPTEPPTTEPPTTELPTATSPTPAAANATAGSGAPNATAGSGAAAGSRRRRDGHAAAATVPVTMVAITFVSTVDSELLGRVKAAVEVAIAAGTFEVTVRVAGQLLTIRPTALTAGTVSLSSAFTTPAPAAPAASGDDDDSTVVIVVVVVVVVVLAGVIAAGLLMQQKKNKAKIGPDSDPTAEQSAGYGQQPRSAPAALTEPQADGWAPQQALQPLPPISGSGGQPADATA